MIDMERQEALTEAHRQYLTALADYQELLNKYPISHRTLPQMDEISKAEGRCIVMKQRYEVAQSERYKL